MTFSQKSMSLALLCLASSVALAQPAPNARTGSSNLNVATPGTLIIVAQPVAKPGILKVFKASVYEVVAGTPIGFTFAGKGYCKIQLDTGDGHITNYEGELTYLKAYTYTAASMSSFDSSKTYTATATPSGDCKATGPMKTTVTVTNPAPQGAQAPVKPVSIISANPHLTVKPGAVANEPPTIKSITHTGTTVAGGTTLLTVNGSGICKYRLTYLKIETPQAAVPQMFYSSSTQANFPMDLELMKNLTPVGTFKWTATGVEGCKGSADVTFNVQ